MAKFTYKYVIIGGGMTADAAARSIKEQDPRSKIGLIGRETHPPYARPPLSKALWKGEEEVEDIYMGTEEVEIDMHLGKNVIKIDRSNKKVMDDQKNEYSYEKLLIATGGTPRKLPKIEEQGIIYYRTLEDYEKLKLLLDNNNTNFGIIGGSFIGSEIAAAIKIYKPEAKVTMIFPETGICALIFPKGLSDFLNNYYMEKGIKIVANDLVMSVIGKGNTYQIDTKEGKHFEFDAIIAGLGIKPNVELAQNAGLKVDNGIVVNEYLQTTDPNIYAAGDVVSYYNEALKKHVRVEHEDNAWYTGDSAGRNMVGAKESFEYLSLFYSDLFDYGYEAVGELDPRLEIIEDWADKYGQGIVYFLKDTKIRGVLLWNVWEKAEAARELIFDQKSFKSKDLKGKISFE
jgi:3-phenylpropionate/trans-cinnamate dioxygenase ferredoxin reductase subunit